ncbi:hypothetical protein [Sphingomonas sp. HMP6]|uniref:hypothetical protein n=1 Tax=Sphingomonas sp. HMP6 TaxID=1517551 RepID=UPI001596592C|nr:hypothetical protein [Sphingomonas sp. HMP6]BCA59754.1 hypothetical protein HMP06_2523 [Sphingomonas sp. HMP6]
MARADSGPSTSSGRTEEGAGSALPTKGVGSALDAERAFAADAQTLGQWTAFRKWAASDATMFVPQPINAQTWLKDRTDPAKAIAWWPTASYVSCDGSMAVNTGGWQRPDGAVGHFSTVWQRQRDGGWKWIVDSGDASETARVKSRARPTTMRASCKPTNLPPPRDVFITSEAGSADGSSNDGTLIWGWNIGQNGGRDFLVVTWEGSAWGYAVWNRIAPPSASKP